jgi:uncharacterized DUF497 family protein
MIIEGFIWLDWVVEKLLLKHNVGIVEVEEVFSRRPAFIKKEKGRVEGEHLYNALGQTAAGRYLSVFFIYKHSKQALIVSAREMNPKERRRYAHK